MTSADILLILVLAGAFLIGFFWGVLRGLLALLAWAVVFLLSAQLSEVVGNYLANQWRNFSADYDHMLAFLICFGFLFVVALVLIQIGTRSSQDLSRYPLLDDILGGLLGMALAVLTVASVIGILHTGLQASSGAAWSANLYQGLTNSTIGGQISSGLLPVIRSLTDPLLPDAVRARL